MDPYNDDISIGPMYGRKGRYTESQLLSFAKHISTLRYQYTTNIEKLKAENPDETESIRKILFDNGLVRAQLYINHNQYSKEILLRMLQRFISCLKEHNISVKYDDWFFTKPAQVE